MKKTLLIISAALMVIGSNASAQMAESDFYKNYVEGKLEIGLRMNYFSFSDSHQRTYDQNGNLSGGYTEGISTYRLDEIQTDWPTPYLRYNLMENLALHLGWEHLEGDAWTLDQADPHTDGQLIMGGPSFMALGRYPNETIVTPYGGMGFALLFADFEESRDEGGSNWYGNGKRTMQVDDDLAFMFTMGCTIEIWENLSADLSFNYLGAESDAGFMIDGREQPQTWTFPAENTYFSFGLQYNF